jgi:hypothetical protein
VIGGAVGAGVAGTKQAGKWLACLIEIAEQRVKAEAPLVVAGGPLLLGVGVKQGGVEVEGDRLRPRSAIPGALASLGPGGA